MKKNVVFIIVIDDCYDYDTQLTIKAFSTRQKALGFFRKAVKGFFALGMEYDTVENNDGDFYAYDEGWWARDHYSVRLYEEEIQ